MEKRKCIIILGMHRSGTSALAGCLNQLNVNFGRNIVDPSFDNPKGFFENFTIQKINDAILDALEIKWDFPGNLEKDWIIHPEVKKLQADALEAINAEFGDSKVICIKDPRICHLLPFWQKLLTEAGYRINCLYIVRHPQEVATSLAKRNNLSPNKSYLIYASYLLNAIKNSAKLNRGFISYTDLLSAPTKSLSKALKSAGLSELAKVAEKEKFNTFLDKKMHHHKSIKSAIKDKNILPYLNSTYSAPNRASKLHRKCRNM